MEKEEAIERIEDYMRVHELSKPHTHSLNEAFKMAITALENMGCGCGLCLAHNNMKCPKMK